MAGRIFPRFLDNWPASLTIVNRRSLGRGRWDPRTATSGCEAGRTLSGRQRPCADITKRPRWPPRKGGLRLQARTSLDKTGGCASNLSGVDFRLTSEMAFLRNRPQRADDAYRPGNGTVGTRPTASLALNMRCRQLGARSQFPLQSGQFLRDPHALFAQAAGRSRRRDGSLFP